MTTQVANDSLLLQEALSHFPAGVVALSATVHGERQVMIASSFSVGVSYEPSLVLFSVQKSSSTWPKIKDAPLIGVSVMGEDHNPVCRQLASRDKSKRFNGVETVVGTEVTSIYLGLPFGLRARFIRKSMPVITFLSCCRLKISKPIVCTCPWCSIVPHWAAWTALASTSKTNERHYNHEQVTLPQVVNYERTSPSI